MSEPTVFPCDGCGQAASLEHIARRLRRLEWTTRYRPVHLRALLLGTFGPAEDSEFLYSPDARFEGVAGRILSAVEISREGKSVTSVQSEFQKRGLLLAHMLECPVETGLSAHLLVELLERRLTATVSRIRRSLKPRRVLLISPDLEPVRDKLKESDLGCSVELAILGATGLDQQHDGQEFAAFQRALSAVATS
jgi:hypothetical protein